ncbi:hypothetical protein J0H58_09855 [bacterium]|mgnify:CR=1 FL=1|nr:hypothetical protein [bacterium]
MTGRVRGSRGEHPGDNRPLSFPHLPEAFGAPVLGPEPQLSAPLDPDTTADILKATK